ncbi:MAG: hypothetical protein R3314_11580 [Longimicrobiales bacterium]|nr:hypothetical protein [Longimicrobiales bacterium]
MVTHFSGRVTDDEFVELYRSMFADDAYELGTNELADLRGVDDLDLSAQALRRVEELTEERYAGSDIGFRTAIIAPRDKSYGIGRMYEVFAEQGPENVRVCRDVSEALAWLDLEPDAVEL